MRKLAAILRLADALDREHAHRVRAVRAEKVGGEVRLTLEGDGDLLLERWALERKGEFFRRIFDVKLRVSSDAESDEARGNRPGARRDAPTEPPPGK